MPRRKAPTIKLHASYLGDVFDSATKLVTVMRSRLAEAKVEYDTLIGTGLSGSLIIPHMARALRKNFAIVRKPGSSHSTTRIEGTIGAGWLFVDDLIATGQTFTRVHGLVNEIARDRAHTTELRGAFLYFGILDGTWRSQTSIEPGYKTPDFCRRRLVT